MKVFTYDNITTGRKQETLHAETEQEVVDVMSKLGYQVNITAVFDPDELFKEPGGDVLPSSSIIPPEQSGTSEVKEILPVFFETNDIKFKIIGSEMFKQEWVEITDKQDKYRVIKELKGKSNSVRESNITNEIKLYAKEWVEVETQNE